MDLSLLEYACGMGAWISLIILVAAFILAEENAFYTTAFTKALLSFLVPAAIMSSLYIVFELSLMLCRMILWILILMIRPDILGTTVFIVLLSLTVVTLHNVMALMNPILMVKQGTMLAPYSMIEEVD
jgi:hypothetical protein